MEAQFDPFAQKLRAFQKAIDEAFSKTFTELRQKWRKEEEERHRRWEEEDRKTREELHRRWEEEDQKALEELQTSKVVATKQKEETLENPVVIMVEDDDDQDSDMLITCESSIVSEENLSENAIQPLSEAEMENLDYPLKVPQVAPDPWASRIKGDVETLWFGKNEILGTQTQNFENASLPPRIYHGGATLSFEEDHVLEIANQRRVAVPRPPAKPPYSFPVCPYTRRLVLKFSGDVSDGVVRFSSSFISFPNRWSQRQNQSRESHHHSHKVIRMTSSTTTVGLATTFNDGDLFHAHLQYRLWIIAWIDRIEQRSTRKEGD